MTRALLAYALALLLAAAASPAADAPSYEVGRDGTLVVSTLPEVLSRPEVRPHLTTGLTTSFIVTVTATDPAGRPTRGAARVDVRWEPWDEVFHVVAMGADGRAHRETMPSFERLAGWWRGLELPVAAGLARGRWQVKVELSVVPFSQSEQKDAQRWLSNAPPAEAPSDEPPATVDSGSRLNGVVDLLIATSIQRRSIVRFAWPASQRQPSEHRP